ncbi:MAG: hypothetical protein IMZ66_06350, partial [Planctomycetes bacterium]|nr:hypothetical protein [Planctomycetota bacterium]
MPDAPGLAITGLGLVLPQGAGVAAADAVFAGPGAEAAPRSAVRFLGDVAGLPDATGAPVAGFAPPACTDGLDRAVQFAVAAADEAWRGAGLDRAPAAPDRVATILS